MAKALSPITGCFKKANSMDENLDSAHLVGKDKEESASREPKSTESGLLWSVPSKLYNIGSGAVGLGVGSIKWAATTSYNVGSGVATATQNVMSKVGIPGIKLKQKNKKE